METKYDTDNIFAKILRGEIPCDKVFENEFALAFNDISPLAPVHVLVIPKGEYISFDDFTQKASSDEMSGFYRAVQEVANKLEVQKKGYRLVANIGKDARQEVLHYHIHILAGRDLGGVLSSPE